MITAKRLRAGRRYLRALACFCIAAADGRLPAEARWILDSRVAFGAKKNTEVPRPIRIGEA
eukprot:8380512-Lingulodinium_polyedra.AAC.1